MYYGDIISNEHARRKEILQSIDERESTIWVYKQYILQEKAKMNLELFSQFTSHSEKDKLASISYNYDTRSVSYETYLSAKATIAENIMPSAPNFEPANISPVISCQLLINHRIAKVIQAKYLSHLVMQNSQKALY